VRTFSSLRGCVVVTESGWQFGHCRDIRATLGRGNPTVEALVVGRRGLLEHFGIGDAAQHRCDAVPWESVVRIEGGRIVVRDGTEVK